MDQASALRKFVQSMRAPLFVEKSKCEIMAVTSGKGGVGKSNTTLNTALALSQLGRKVLILDADIGTANIDILLGLDPRRHLGHVLDGSATLLQILEKVTDNLYLIPGASGIADLGTMPLELLKQFRNDILKIEEMFDYLLVDTSAGVHHQVINLLKGSDRVLLICTPEPTSIVDAYALCKVLFKEAPGTHVELVVNNVVSLEEAHEVYEKLCLAVKHFLNRELPALEYIVYHDEGIAHGVINQKPVMMTAASSSAVQAYESIAAKLNHPDGWVEGKGVYQLLNLLTQ